MGHQLNFQKLPSDLSLLEMEIENLIQQITNDRIENFDVPTDSSFSEETRALYHSIKAPAPVFLES